MSVENELVDGPEIVVDEPRTNEEDNGGTRLAGTDTEPKSVKSLLAAAMERDPSGKFAGKAGELGGEQATGVPTVEQVATVIPHPTNSNLSTQEQATLSSLPEESRAAVQSMLEARGTAYAQHAQQLSEQVRGYSGIEQIVGPRREAWAMQGVAPEQALNQLLALSDFAGRDPGQFIQWFSNQHGLDLYQLAEGYTPPDPQFVALQREIAELKGAMGQQTTQQQQQAHTNVMHEIGQFAQEQGADGKPARPHFNAVVEDMVHLMPGVMAQNGGMSRRDALQVCYDRAVWANPVTRALMQNAAAADTRVAAAATAANARRASKSITTGAPAGDVQSTAASSSKTVRGALEAAFAAGG